MSELLNKNTNYKILSRDVIKSDPLEAIEYTYRLTRSIEIVIQHPEFTSVCPMTGLPDFGCIIIEYWPNQTIIELKSLKYYLLQYRNVGIFYEHLVNHILDDLVLVLSPEKMKVTGQFSSRGGLKSTVSACYEEEK